MITVRQRVEFWLEAIARDNPRIGAFVYVGGDDARAAAEACDVRIAEGAPVGPCAGIPLAVKDNVDVAGMPCAVGIGAYRSRIATKDARLVTLWRESGGIVLGKTAMDEGALGALTDNPSFGRCDNPAAPGHTPGGSSGGSAAAVAAGMAPLALGSDTLGSVRIPASYCGVIGFKPTRGILSRQGVATLSWTLDHPGILARDIDRLAVAFGCLAVHDENDPDSVLLPAAAPAATDRPLVLGVPEQISGVALEPEVAAAFSAARDALAAAGIEIREVNLAGWDPERLRRSAFIVAEVEGAVAFADLLADERSEISPLFRRLLSYGRDLPAPRYANARRYCAEAGIAARRALRGVDALFLPTTPQTAFPAGAKPPPDQADFTALASAGGLPAISIPYPAPGRPVGMQFVGAALLDYGLIDVARRVQDIFRAVPATVRTVG